jgi:hypothetical protein
VFKKYIVPLKNNIRTQEISQKVKITPLALRNFPNSSTPPFFAPHLPAV